MTELKDIILLFGKQDLELIENLDELLDQIMSDNSNIDKLRKLWDDFNNKKNNIENSDDWEELIKSFDKRFNLTKTLLIVRKLFYEIESENPNAEKIRELLIEAFNSANDTSLSKDIDDDSDECKQVIRWLNNNIGLLQRIFSKDVSLTLPKLSLQFADKVTLLSQYHCPICTSDYPICIIPIEPI